MSELFDYILEQHQKGYCCAQILAMAVLDAAGQDEPGLVSAVSGLCGGVAWTGEGTCACLTGGACVLSYFTGSNAEREADKENFQPALWDYMDWFAEKMDGQLGCMDILNRDMGNRLETCPDIIAECYEKIMEILEARNLI